MAVSDSRTPPRLISVVIPVLNGASIIGEQLDALSRQDHRGPWEVVVVDNGSTDDTVAVVESFRDRLPALSVVSASPAGHTIARNAGARAANGDFLLYCDADDVVSPRWVSAMAEAAAGADLLGGYVDDTVLNDDVNVGWRTTQDPSRLPTKMDFLPLAITANFGIRASVLAEVGGFNDNYGEGCNDVEICWRAQLAGYELAYVPDAVIAYRYRPSLKSLARQMYRRGLAEPQLYRDFRARGVPRRRPTDSIRAIASVVAKLPDVARGSGPRGRWVKRVCLLAGRLRGSLRHRVLYV